MPDIERLVREIQKGRGTSEHFRELFDYYVPRIIFFFLRRHFSRIDAEDLAQDVFLRVYRKIGTFRFQASFDTWVFSIVASTWKNSLRSRDTLKRRMEKHSLDDVFPRDGAEGADPAAEPPDPEESPLDQALSEERKRKLLEAIGELPAKMGQTATLRAEGYKYREIAEVMGVTIATVKKQLGTASQRLRSLLEKDFDVFDL